MTDNPTITTYPDGTRSEDWWLDGKRHRTDGPAYAYTYPDGTRYEW